jgi:hypothetical protein
MASLLLTFLMSSHDPPLAPKLVLPFAAGEPPAVSQASEEVVPSPSADESCDQNPSTSNSAWDFLPGDNPRDDPRYDRHGFRRDASKLEREEAFLAAYEERIEQQEQRWARHMSDIPHPVHEQYALDALPRSELKRLSRLGIPARRRCVLWPKLCKADELRATEAPGYFAALLAEPNATPGQPGFAAERQIELDLARTFPGHRALNGEGGINRLRQVLLAYARRAPAVGYVQGMGFVAALLLIFVEEPETAFWCLAAVVEFLLPVDFFSATLLGLRIEQAVFNDLVAIKLPKVSKQLRVHGVIAELFATRWFVALFANSLPIETTLRVWDAFLLEGQKVLHRVGLAMLRVSEARLLQCQDQQELLCTLQEEQAGCFDCERLMTLAFDRYSFLRSFPRARVDALRRKHRVRLLLAEGQSTPPRRLRASSSDAPTPPRSPFSPIAPPPSAELPMPPLILPLTSAVPSTEQLPTFPPPVTTPRSSAVPSTEQLPTLPPPATTLSPLVPPSLVPPRALDPNLDSSDDEENEDFFSANEQESYEILSQDDLPRTPPRAHVAKSTTSLYRELWL